MKTKIHSSIVTFFGLMILGCTYVSAAETSAVNPAITPIDRNELQWWKERHAAKLAEVKQKADNVELLMIGDSITHWWEEDQGSPVWNKYYASRKPFNIGYAGDRTEHVLWRLDHGEIDGINPKLSVMMIGTNNIGHGSSTPEQTVEGVKMILARLEQKLPETKVLLLSVFPRGTDEHDDLRKKVNQINLGLPALADGKQVYYLDIGSKFVDENKVLPKSIMPDLLHPNTKGYEIWAEAIEPSVAKLLEDK
ncbi:platelet-activating factor acetylhydrolase IB subunit [Shewanella sp. Isolate11]|uniref:platelet-activating factor acetylhydrolase IB subunit n=1 Tax=Shewanella sp. Isolate11 TaxID=2908530 RepID=UPI001EFC9DE1|nr:platelet-activating factor acetylhydrolase IB subunit [Shewanella sp. Isolate11]MCG9695920.1 GDSL-type esterase/lipase family protein [Shewanella sp. Isolate11]